MLEQQSFAVTCGNTITKECVGVLPHTIMLMSFLFLQWLLRACFTEMVLFYVLLLSSILVLKKRDPCFRVFNCQRLRFQYSIVP
jgi:hypothetical protein